MKLCRKLIPLLLALFLLIVFAIPAYAIDNTPDTLSINAIEVYDNAKEVDDWVMFVDFTVDYASSPTERINDTYIIRFTSGDGTTTYATATPYGYFDLGWARGVVGFYVSAADVTALSLTWEGTYKIYLEGNPTADWDATPVPLTSSASFSWHASDNIADARDLITAKILYYAQTLTYDWADEDYVLYTPSSLGGFMLSTAGHAYFTATIPYLQDIAPDILAASQPEMEFINREYSSGWQGTIDAYIAGTIFDLDDLATSWGISTRVLTSALWLAATILLIILMTRKINSFKPAILLAFPLIVCGALIGWIPVVAAMCIGFLMSVASWFILTWDKSSA